MTPKNPEDISICLNCYKIKFKERYKPDTETMAIEKVFGTTSLFDIYQAFAKNVDNKAAFRNKKQDRVLYLRDTMQASKSSNVVAGVIMKGHNGPETAIDELVKGEVRNVSKVTAEQFHCHPYFFLIYMKKEDPQEMILIAQSYRQFGFKEVFEEAFRTFTEEQVNPRKITLMFNTLSVASLFEKYINDGRIYKLRFVKHGLTESAEALLYGEKSIDQKGYEMEMSIKSSRGFHGIKKAIKYDDASFIEQVQLEGFEFNQVFADVIVGGRKRVMNVTQPSEFSAAYDITHEVAVNSKTKHPNFQEVLERAVDILNTDLIPNI